MRRNRSPRPFLFLLGAILTLMSLPKGMTERVQGLTISFFSPFFSLLNGSGKPAEENSQLALENQLLKNEMRKFQKILGHEIYIQKLAQQCVDPAFADTHLRELERKHLLALELQSIPASVLFRPPEAWNSMLWVKAGQIDNEKRGREIICKNSPVVIGNTIVGVIDYVGTRQSRVRLLTDSKLNPSVRAIRTVDNKSWRLGKGELKGSSGSEWRKKGKVLQGTGFNYDFSDEEGPERDLRTGEAMGTREPIPPLPIVQPGDFLVTTGMDGVFPPGLLAGKVSHVQDLQEGDFCYDLEAIPSCGQLDSLTVVAILPPVGYDPFDQPPAPGSL